MRISDWSSDVCSSDLPGTDQFYDAYISMGQTAENVAARHGIAREDQERLAVDSHAKAARAQADGLLAGEKDRKSVVAGKRVSVRVDLGGGRSIKKKNTTNTHMNILIQPDTRAP